MRSLDRRMLLPVVLAAFVNAVPSLAELHPLGAARAPIDDDLMGSGYERGVAMPLPRAARREDGPPARRLLSKSEIDEARRRLDREMRVAAALAVVAATVAAFLLAVRLM